MPPGRAREILVVGAGIAGLYAACRLLHAGHQVRIIEKANYAGGRLLTVHDIEQGWQYEAGGARFHAGHARLIRLMEKLGVGRAPLPAGMQHVPRQGKIRDIDVDAALAAFCNANTVQTGVVTTAHESSEVDAAAVTALQQEVGYDAEFNVSHVADCQRSVCNDLISKHPFFIVKGGYSAIIDKLMARLAKRGVAAELRTELLEFGHTPADPPRVRARVRKQTPSGEQEETEREYDDVILAIPPGAARAVTGFSDKIKDEWSRTLGSAPLMRIYAAWDAPWWAERAPRKTTVDRRRKGCEHIQFFIPLGHPRLAMASYSDGDTARWWQARAEEDASGASLRAHLTRELRSAFGDDIPEPAAVFPHYWPAGVHMFTPRPGPLARVADRELVRRWVRPDPRVRVFMANEGFSYHHQWVEGSLESACRALRALAAAAPEAVRGGGRAPRVRLEKSPKAAKKFCATVWLSSNKRPIRVHFGAAGMEDYTMHGDKARRRRYLRRHRKREDWTLNGIATPGFWSRWLLWHKRTIRASRASISKCFGVRFVR